MNKILFLSYTANPFAVNTTYTSSWTTNSAWFTRYNYVTGTYYFDAYRVTVPTTGYYRCTTLSTIDTYGYFYNGTFTPSTPGTNLITWDDDSGGSAQFQLVGVLQANVVYVLIATTYGSNIVGPYTLLASGPSTVNIVRLNYTSTVSTATVPVSTTSFPSTAATATGEPGFL